MRVAHAFSKVSI